MNIYTYFKTLVFVNMVMVAVVTDENIKSNDKWKMMNTNLTSNIKVAAQAKAPSNAMAGSFDRYIMYLCKKYGYHGENCTCENANKHVTGNLCSVKVRNETRTYVTFTCQRKNNLIEATFSLIASIIGLIGNGIVILISFRNWSKFRNCQQLIGYLAFSDSIYSLVNLIIRIPLFWDCRWKYGLGMCRGIHGLSDISSNMALGFIVIISIERYCGIVKPFSRGLRGSKLYILSGLNVLAAIITVAPLFPVRYITEHGLCSEYWSPKYGQKIYDWFLAIFYFFIPLLVILLLYWQIMSKLRNTVNNANCTMIDAENRKKRLQDNKRIMTILGTVVIAFFLLVFPGRIVWLIFDYAGHNNLSMSAWTGLKLFLFIPYYFHVICNPIIYSLVDKRFRSEVIKLLQCERQRRGSATQMLDLNRSKISMTRSKTSVVSIRTSPDTKNLRHLTVFSCRKTGNSESNSDIVTMSEQQSTL